MGCIVCHYKLEEMVSNNEEPDQNTDNHVPLFTRVNLSGITDFATKAAIPLLIFKKIIYLTYTILRTANNNKN